MARYIVDYDNHNYVTTDLGTTYRVNLPLIRPLRALCLDIDIGAVTGALTLMAPESCISRMVLKADTDVIADIEGFEAWLLASCLGYAIAPKRVSVATTPKSTIILPFGRAFALNLPSYRQVTAEITICAAFGRLAATSWTTATSWFRLYGVEQDALPLKDASGARLTRRFLRQQHAVPIGQLPIKLDPGVAYNNLLMCSFDVMNGTTLTPDLATDPPTNNIRNILLRAAVPGRELRLLDCNYLTACNQGLFDAGLGQMDPVAAINATLLMSKLQGVAWVELGDGDGPLDLPGLQCSAFECVPTGQGVLTTEQLSIVRDVLVKG
ncbi:MAG TPA: hypothetical protein VM487_13780 [Phycisphaerae bacterium]|nr:hypothetical protein [Phycisphaerae bacterium]